MEQRSEIGEGLINADNQVRLSWTEETARRKELEEVHGDTKRHCGWNKTGKGESEVWRPTRPPNLFCRIFVTSVYCGNTSTSPHSSKLPGEVVKNVVTGLTPQFSNNLQ